MKNEPSVSIIILGWNNYDDVVNCLDSLGKINHFNHSIVLVDNNSEATSFQILEKWLKSSKRQHVILEKDFDEIKSLDLGLTIIKSEKNLGFTGGNNLACDIILNASNPDYILLLNGDTLVSEDFLSNLIKECEKDRKIGSAQAVLLRFDKHTVDSLGLGMKGRNVYDVDGEKDKSVLAKYDRIHEIFGACGAAAIYRSDIIRKIGLFDEGLFATYEDFDIAWRIRLEGFKTVLVRDSVVYHRGGISRSSKGHKRFDFRSYYAARNVLVVYARYYPITLDIFLNSIVWFGVGIISAIKNHKTKDFVAALANLSKDRRKIAKNKYLKQIQKKWIEL